MSEDYGYTEFPLTMTHPGYRPSIMKQYGPNEWRGTPEAYGPVTVNNATEEEAYMAEGYRRAGKIDPSAWVRNFCETPPEEFQPVQYPKWVKFEGQDLLCNTIEDDPTVSADARAEATAKRVAHEKEVGGVPTPPLPVPDPKADELRKTTEDLQEQMRQMMAQMQAMAQENAALKAAQGAGSHQGAQANEEPRRKPGRPRKAA